MGSRYFAKSESLFQSFPRTTLPYVMTTDFLLTVKDLNGNFKSVARTVKYRSDLVGKGSNRTLEKLEIEKRFWHSQGVDWKIVTDEFFTRDLIKNLGLIRKYSKLHRDLMKVPLHSNFIDCLANSREYSWTLATCLRKIACLLSISYIDAQAIFFHLVWNKILKIDLVNTPLHLTGLVPDFEVFQIPAQVSLMEKMS
ncbi:TnsA endonuclease N-terminal domain-containing protein [Pseudomonas sp. 4810-S13]|uniref:TnsA endonuclease N-terminal domain-containing protein n=1 Tax=Pseudomonas sp. 4810-S13 TaxID=3120822 RepID=UPI0031B6DB5A